MATTTIVNLDSHTSLKNADLFPVGANGDSVLKKVTFKTIKEYIINLLYPVGTIYESTDDTNPGTFLGVGTWSSYGRGRVLVGAGTLDDVTYEATATGGAVSVKPNIKGTLSETKLATDMVPSHSHGLNLHTHPIGTHTHYIAAATLQTESAGAHKHTMKGHNAWVAQSSAGKAHLFPNYTEGGTVPGSEDYDSAMKQASNHKHDIKIAAKALKTLTGTGGDTGSGGSEATKSFGKSGTNLKGHTHEFTGVKPTVEVMQPYVVVYRWRRTA